MTQVFISYSHVNEALKQRFVVHLASLRREGIIGVWHDRMMRPGEHFDSKIAGELAASDLIVLPISSDFINSDYCIEKEMQQAFARAQTGKCQVVPVVLRPCGWTDIPLDGGGKLGDFIALPRDGKPVTEWPNEDRVFTDIVAALRAMILGKTAPAPPPGAPSAPAPGATATIVAKGDRSVAGHDLNGGVVVTGDKNRVSKGQQNSR